MYVCNVCVWFHYTIKSIEKLEKVKKRATKLMLKTKDCYPGRQIKKLDDKRSIFTKKKPIVSRCYVTFLYKALRGIIYT